MNLFASTLATATLLIPAERHIDFSGWPGEALTANVEIDMRVTAMDGTVYETTILATPDATVTHVRDILWGVLKDDGWRGRTVEKGIIVLEGSKKSAIRSVEFKSKVWIPDVRVVPLVPANK